MHCATYPLCHTAQCHSVRKPGCYRGPANFSHTMAIFFCLFLYIFVANVSHTMVVFFLLFFSFYLFFIYFLIVLCDMCTLSHSTMPEYKRTWSFWANQPQWHFGYFYNYCLRSISSAKQILFLLHKYSKPIACNSDKRRSVSLPCHRWHGRTRIARCFDQWKNLHYSHVKSNHQQHQCFPQFVQTNNRENTKVQRYWLLGQSTCGLSSQRANNA